MLVLGCETAVPPAQECDEALFVHWRRDGHEWAREALVERYLPLARRLAMRYVRSSEPLDDLVQVANLGLLKAIERFDPDRAHRFASFAVPTILGELRRYFRDCGWAVHVPRGAQERALLVEHAQREWVARHGRAATVQQIAEYTELDLEDVLEALRASRAYEALSLDAPREGADGEAEPLIEALGARDDGFALVEDTSSVSAGLSRLTRREREILYLRFVQDLTQSEIARHVGVSQMQISRTLRRVLAQLREFADIPDAPVPPH